MLLYDKVKEGIFFEECKNRFLCKVLIDNEIEECYIPSSSRLDNYISLRKRKILLTENKATNSRTKYSVFAFKHKHRYVILNLGIANKILIDGINNGLLKIHGFDSIYSEKYYNGYKTDILCIGKDTMIIEAKGIISLDKEAMFPSVFSQRSIDQLRTLLQFIKSGIQIQYYLVSLSPFVESIRINSNMIEYYSLLTECIHSGMVIKGISCSFKNSRLNIGIEIPIIV